MNGRQSLLTRGGKVTVVSLRKNIADLRNIISSGKLSPSMIYEIRYDLTGEPIEAIGDMVDVMIESGLEFIFTYRGDSGSSVKAYEAAFRSGADLLDIDLALIGLTDGMNCRRIVSFHGDWKMWDEVLGNMLHSRPFAIKLASHFQDAREFLMATVRAMNIRESLEYPFCFSPMGNIPAMRYIACLYASDFCYASFDEPTAEGQPAAERYQQFMQLIDGK